MSVPPVANASMDSRSTLLLIEVLLMLPIRLADPVHLFVVTESMMKTKNVKKILMILTSVLSLANAEKDLKSILRSTDLMIPKTIFLAAPYVVMAKLTDFSIPLPPLQLTQVMLRNVIAQLLMSKIVHLLVNVFKVLRLTQHTSIPVVFQYFSQVDS